jgi:hypothetical protein
MPRRLAWRQNTPQMAGVTHFSGSRALRSPLKYARDIRRAPLIHLTLVAGLSGEWRSFFGNAGFAQAVKYRLKLGQIR